MKIVFFSDVHGNQYAMRQFVNRLDEEKADLIVFGGDIFGYYYGQKEILSCLEKSEYVCIKGNHDQYLIDLIDGKIDLDYLVNRYGSTYRNAINSLSELDVTFLRSLRMRYDLEVDGLHLSFVHGSLDNPLNGRIYPDTHIEELSLYRDVDYVFMGHTHHKMIIKLPNGTMLLNPGSIGQQRDGKGCTYGIFDTVSKNWSVNNIEFDIDDLVREIEGNDEKIQVKEKLIEVLYRKSSS